MRKLSGSSKGSSLETSARLGLRFAMPRLNSRVPKSVENVSGSLPFTHGPNGILSARKSAPRHFF
jgi:hypothetical protein